MESPFSSTEAIAALASDDTELFRAFVEHFQHPLFGFIGRMGFAQADAEDLAQEVFLKAWRHRASYDPTRAQPSTWLFTIARNTALNKLQGTNLTINGERLNTDAETETETLDGRSWQVQWTNSGDASSYELTVEAGHAFVLGDNRSRSKDSRSFGQVPLSDIVGKARQVWFSKVDDKIRWSRIGLRLN